MFKTKVIKVDRFTSKNGKACAVAWYGTPSGLPARNFVDVADALLPGDEITVSVEPGYDCTGRIVIKKV